MAVVVNGDGSITGLSVGGLPDGTVDSDTLANNAVVTGKITDGTIVNADINSSAAIAGSKLIMPSGSVLQVIQSTSNTATYPTTGWTNIASAEISITPSSTSSKILYIYNAGGFVNGSNMRSAGLRIKRSIGSGAKTDIRECGRWGYFSNVGHAPISPSMTYLDSPNTTSACNYYMEALEENSGGYEINDTVQTNGAVVIVMEIAG